MDFNGRDYPSSCGACFKVMELLMLKGSRASKLLSNLAQADIIEAVSGYGKEKYRFKKY